MRRRRGGAVDVSMVAEGYAKWLAHQSGEAEAGLGPVGAQEATICDAPPASPTGKGMGEEARPQRRLLPRHVMIADDSGVRSFLSWISERVSRVQYNPDTTPV